MAGDSPEPVAPYPAEALTGRQPHDPDHATQRPLLRLVTSNESGTAVHTPEAEVEPEAHATGTAYEAPEATHGRHRAPDADPTLSIAPVVPKVAKLLPPGIGEAAFYDAINAARANTALPHASTTAPQRRPQHRSQRSAWMFGFRH